MKPHFIRYLESYIEFLRDYNLGYSHFQERADMFNDMWRLTNG